MPSINTVLSATLVGVKCQPVQVEVSVSNGLPGISIVGMPDIAVQESRERVRAAIRASGYALPAQKIVVNLAPSSLKKSGSGFDLPIALGILRATGQAAPAQEPELVIGELSLDGTARAITGTLAFELCAKEIGASLVFPKASMDAIEIDGLKLKGVASLIDASKGLYRSAISHDSSPCPSIPDFSEVAGQDFAKRALQIAACGNHGILLVGPPGSGKTMLAARLPSILPSLSEKEAMETALVHSVAGMNPDAVLARQRPFRSPHHSITTAGLIGGGKPIKPGEISLAHNGVCFLDEIAEFRPSTLQAIREPLESGEVTLVRAGSTVRFPASFMLAAASNPCPCGFFGDAEIACSCTLPQIKTYQNRIGGPLLDRISIKVNVGRTPASALIRPTASHTSSEELREGVALGREFASWRRAKGLCAKGTSVEAALEECSPTDEAKALLEASAKSLAMSARGIARTLSIARTIADISQMPHVNECAMAEALGLRTEERCEHAR